MIESGPQMIVHGPSMGSISVREKIEWFIDGIVEGMEILVSPSSTIIDDVEIIVKETELIVTKVLSKGKTEGTDTDERGVSDVKQSACLVGLGDFIPNSPRWCPLRALTCGPTTEFSLTIT